MIIKHDLLNFDVSNGYFEVKVDELLLVKYLKGAYRGNKPRFEERFINYFEKAFKAYDIEESLYLLDNMKYLWDLTTTFTYEEAFKVKNSTFKSIVFSSIDIREMIDNLGAVRIKTEGKDLINKVWNQYKQEFESTPYSVIYELYHVNGEKLGINNSTLPVVKCWCTTTNEEHWLWVDNDSFKNNSPLEAIASTCKIYKSMKNKIKHIIRQGDVFLFEMLEDVEPSENEEIINLPMEEYFRLLKSQA